MEFKLILILLGTIAIMIGIIMNLKKIDNNNSNNGDAYNTNHTNNTDYNTDYNTENKTDSINETQKEIDYFIATYECEKDKRIKAFNPLSVLINDSQYYITYLEEPKESNSENLRNIDETETEINITNTSRGYFDSPIDNGFIKIKVYFLDPLPSLDFLFYGCDDLINVDLSHINTTDMSRISYTFYNCKNVEQINFTSLDTSNLQYTEFLFAGCENLVDIIGFENINTSLIKYTTGMFFDCKNLRMINLSSFNLDDIEEQYGMFVNTTSLQMVNLGNCTDANNLFDTNQEYNLIVLGNQDINTSSLSGNIKVYSLNETNNITELLEDLACVIGDGEKCASCSMEEGKQAFCGYCNEGYYLPFGNQYSKTKCKKCDEGCLSCYAEENSDISICLYCDFNYNLYNGKCIEYCEIGDLSSCTECKSELEGKNDECLSCNEGYYFDINYSKRKCKKIEIENCINATTEDGIVKCLNCSKGYMLYENNCYESCKTGDGKKCKTCNPSFEYRFYCGSCNKYYYLYNGVKTSECKRCNSSNYCDECEFIAGEEVCIKCYDGYTLINGKCFMDCDSFCKNCFFDGINHGICLECRDGSYLKNYDEYKYDYYLESTFIKNSSSIYIDTNTTINIRKYTYGFCNLCPSNCKTCFEKLNNEYDYYCFSCMEGYNLIDYKCDDIQCDIWNGCIKCDKKEKNRCESCDSGYYLNKTTGRCHRCINNCLECNDKNECLKCKEHYVLFRNVCALGCLKGLNEKCKECNTSFLEKCGSCNDGYFLPTDLIDKKECVKCPDNCLNCKGTKNNITCTKCENNCFSLKNGKCVFKTLIDYCISCEDNEIYPWCLECDKEFYFSEIDNFCHPCGENVKECHEKSGKLIIDECFPGYNLIEEKCLKNCEKGVKEKCLSCKTEKTKINQCAECNKGYFMPSDYDKQDICFSCKSEGCIKCSGTISNNICIECHKDYMLYEGKCVKNCEIGNEYKCLTCNTEAGNNDRCNKCNDGYYLPQYSTDINKNSICQKCPIGCLNCYLAGENPKCEECEENYLLKKGQCIKGCGFMKNCLACDDSGEYPRCTICIEGYYFPMDLNHYYDKCYKCSVPGCLTCEGDYDYNDYCLECKTGFEPQMKEDEDIVISCSKLCEIGDNNKCKSCSLDINNCGSCNEGFELEGGICLLKDYDIVAEYVTQNDNNYITLLNSNCIDYMNFDGVDYKPYPFNFILAENSGVHKAFIKLTQNCNYPYLFANNPNLKTIAFFDNFNSLNIDFMNEGFYNSPNLESVDMSNLNLGNNRCFMNYFANDEKLKEVKFPRSDVKNAYYLNGIFENCKSITSIDMSTIYNDNAQYASNMFSGCSNLQSIKINKFKNTQILSNNLLNGLPEKGMIIVSKEIEDTIKKQIPKNWVIEVE